MKKWLIAMGVIALIGIFVVLNLRKGTSKVEVKVTEVKRRDITKLITASGRIEPRVEPDRPSVLDTPARMGESSTQRPLSS